MVLLTRHTVLLCAGRTVTHRRESLRPANSSAKHMLNLNLESPATPLIAFLVTTWRVAKAGVEVAASTLATMIPDR